MLAFDVREIRDESACGVRIDMPGGNPRPGGLASENSR